MNTDKSQSRREFMRSTGRAAAFGVVGVLGYVLGRKTLTADPRHDCSGQGYCRRCDRRDDCILPAAASARAAAAGTGSGGVGEERP